MKLFGLPEFEFELEFAANWFVFPLLRDLFLAIFFSSKFDEFLNTEYSKDGEDLWKTKIVP